MPERETTMVERCAKAIYEKRNGPGCTPWSQQKKLHRAPYLDDARAAIEEMRTPTEAQIDAGVAARMKLYEQMEADGVDTRTLLVSKHPAGTIYAAMVDAALKEPE
jgi:hypothetical protein